MKKQLLAFVMLASVQLICLAPASAYGQWYAGNRVGNRVYPYGGAGLAYGLGYGYGYTGPQTPYSVAATGMGNLVRAEGDYNEQTSKAAINYQQAQSQYIENQQKAIAARMTIKRLAKAEDAKKLEEAHARLARSEEFLAAHRPLPLTSSQLEPSSGIIHWPIALTAADFDDSRKSLDMLFTSKVKYGATSDVSSQIERKANELKDGLRAQITKIPLSEYSEARQFLDRMIASAH